MLIFAGCSNHSSEEYLKVNDMLLKMDTYITKAEIIVNGNKMVESYMVKQYFKYPDKYRIEVLSPPDKQGKITVYDGESLKIYQPQIKQLYVMEDYKEVEEGSMFPGHFAKDLFTSEHAVYDIKNENGNDFISIKVPIPGGNRYRRWEILYFDRQTIKPVKMEVLDDQGKTAVTIYYKEFLYNPGLDDDVFKIKNSEQ